MLRSVLVSFCLALGVASAQAQITAHPGTIEDHGTFVTDTSNALDWYKFRNIQTTVDRSFNEVVAAGSYFMAEGWRVATLDEVHSLWSQFGWTSDTPSGGVTANAGLTDALIGAVGATFSSYVVTGYDARGVIARYAGNLHEAHDTTAMYRETHADPSVEQHLDFVTSSWGALGDNSSNGTGTWLVRDSVAAPVPEPEAYALMLIGLVAIAARRRSAGGTKRENTDSKGGVMRKLVSSLLLFSTLPASAAYYVTGPIYAQDCFNFGISVCSTYTVTEVRSGGKRYEPAKRFERVSEYSAQRGMCWITIKSTGLGALSWGANALWQPEFWGHDKDGKFKKIDAESIRFKCIQGD